METYEVCHGTNADHANQILSTRRFHVSDGEKEWAGSGVYFFLDRDADKNAYSWAKFHKRYADPCVLMATVEIEYANVLDLTDEDECKLFQEHRKNYFKEARARASKYGCDLEEKYLDSAKLDCAVINHICSFFSLEAVKKAVYIRCLDAPDIPLSIYPASFTPNCTIFCLRNQELITKLTKINVEW